MFDLRPVGYVIGLLVTVLGLTMLAPLLADVVTNNGEWHVFLRTSVLTVIAGSLVAGACANSVGQSLNIRQAFLLTFGAWSVLPLFGSLPFMFGETELSFTDAYFEAVSGMTTTGSTVISGLDNLSEGLLLWRGILQWLGGLGIVIVALIFLPVMRVGGMQFFQSEGFDTLGKAMPRVMDLSSGLLNIYVGLTAILAMLYVLLGMNTFEAFVHAMTTMSTGGFSTTDDSFAAFSPGAQYVGALFMVLASVPFVRLFQFVVGQPKPLFQDRQVRAYLVWLAYATLLVAAHRMWQDGEVSEEVFRNSLFNVVSIFSGTGYGDGDLLAWGPFPFMVVFLVGAIGGCTGSTGCSLKVFRYQILLRSFAARIRKLYAPSRVTVVTYSGTRVTEDVLNSIILMFTLFMLTFFVIAVGISLTGMPFLPSVTGAWTAVFNVGPAFGAEVTASGSLENFPETAKWLMTLGMFLGRLEIVAAAVLLLPSFWRG